MKGRYVNKDIMSRLAFAHMQMPHVEKALRAYIKVIDDKAYLRAEKYLTPNKPVGEALDKDFLASG